MLLENSKKQNVFTTLLNLLNVKHTKAFANKYFNEHPHKYNLLGLSQVLSDYGIENAGTIIRDKENDIVNIETPFVAHHGASFIAVNKIVDDKVNYVWNGISSCVKIQDFCKMWTGAILLVESNQTSIEPNYKENKKIVVFNFLKKTMLSIILSIVFVISAVKHSLFNNPQLIIALIINSLGVFMGYLLVEKQMNISSEYADKICLLFKQSDCNDILESKASKFLDVIGWGEIGLAFFISNVFIVVFLPQLINYLSILNVCVLPYSFWSIWYQKWKAKQWCPLCLIAMCILWATFFIDLAFGSIEMPIWGKTDLINIVCIYIIPVLIINLIVAKLSGAGKIEQITQEINSLKANDKIFVALLKQQPYYKVDMSSSSIIFGNPDAKILITILTNPHCDPCSKMHARVDKLLEQTNNLCIQYIFASFEKSLDSSSKFLIATYLNNKIERVREIYSEWFRKGKLGKEGFFQKYCSDIKAEKVDKEFQRQNLWREEVKLIETPTILVAGYKIPENYKIEDLRYFKSLDVDTK